MKFNRKKGIFIILFILMVTVVLYNYVYQDHRNISAELPSATLTSDEVVLKFKQDLSSTKEDFLDKTIIIKGSVSELNTNDLTLDNMVFCNFTEEIPTTIKISNNIKVKGRILGYDELLEIIKLDQCSIVK